VTAVNPAFLAHAHGIAHTDCWCATCEGDAKARLVLAGQMSLIESMCSFMHLCPDCGDKRCPRATWHENQCQNALKAAERKLAAIEAVLAHARQVTPSDRAIIYAADIERALGRDAPTPHKTGQNDGATP